MLDPRVGIDEITATVTACTSTNLISFAPATPSVAVTGAPCTATGDNISVSVAYTYNFLVMPNFLKNATPPLVLNGAALMRCE